jgi:membrane-associated phospholipid phosphatase
MDAAISLQSPANGMRGALSRIRSYWWVKTVGIAAYMTIFFLVYFHLLTHPRFPVTTVPRIFIDKLIPFQPRALPLYLSLWFYVTIAPALLRTRRELLSYTLAATVLSAIGFLVFIFWPTAVPTAEVDPALLPALAHLKKVDASGNAFPSLHVAFAVFNALWVSRQLREMHVSRIAHAVSWIWCLGIVYSTMAIRQHVALDALSGAVLGVAVAAVQMRLLDARKA